MNRTSRTGRVLALSAVLFPSLLGGCPDVMNSLVNGVEDASISVVRESPAETPRDIFTQSVAEGLLAILFDRFRVDPTP